MPRTYRYTRLEQLQLDLADRIQSNQNATPAELLKALTVRQKVVDGAKARLAQSAPPTETTDDLIRQLEARQSAPKALEITPLRAFAGDSSPSERSDTAGQPEKPVAPESAKCHCGEDATVNLSTAKPLCFLHATTAGADRPAPPEPEAPLTADYFERLRAAQAIAARLARPAEPNHVSLRTIWGDLNPQQRRDLEASQQIWREQADQEQQERARLIRDVEYQQRKNSF